MSHVRNARPEQNDRIRVLEIGDGGFADRFSADAFVVGSAHDEQEARRCLEKARPDAILISAARMASVLPGLRTWEVGAGIPVLAILEAEGDAAWEEAMAAGCDDVLRVAQGPLEAAARVTAQVERARARQQTASTGKEEPNFLALAANAPIAIFTKDAGGCYTLANPLAVRALGGQDTVEGLTDFDLLAEAEAEAIRRVDREVMAAGEARSNEELVAGRRFLSVKFPLRDAAGEVSGVCGVALDVTGWKEVDEALKRRTQMVESMNRVSGTLVAEHDLEVIVQTVCDEGRNISGAAFGAFFYNVISDNGEALMLYTLSGAPREAFEKFGMPRNTPVFEKTFHGEGVMRVGDITKDPRYGQMPPHHGMPKGHLPVRSYLALPVVSRSGAVLGGLFFGHPDPDVFTEEAEQILSAVAAQAAVAIDNANLATASRRELTERRRSEEQLGSQRDVLEQIVREASLPEVLEALTDGVERLAERKLMASVMLVEPDGKHLAYAAGSTCPAAWREYVRRIAVGAGIGSCGSSAFSGESHVAVDLDTDPAWKDFRQEARRCGLRACWSSPIRSSAGEVLGTFAIYYPEPAEPSPNERTLVEVVTRTATIAIERARSESNLRASQQRFRTLADNISQFAWMADREGWIYWYNQRWFDYTGTTLEEMKGWGWRAVHHPEHVERVTEKFRDHMQSGVTWEDTFPLRGGDGVYRWFLSRAVPLRDANGDIQQWFGTNTDITEQKLAEEELKRARNRALAASRAKDDFLAALSHELRTPLNPALLVASEAADDPSLPEGVREMFAGIRSHIELEARLIDDLLDLTRITRGKLVLEKSLVDLHEIIREAMAPVRSDLEAKDIALTLSFGIEAPLLIGDSVRLQQVFWNVLRNAVKFTPVGGSLRIETQSVAGNHVVRIEDSGIGMTPEEVERVFEAFAQGEHSIDGSHRFGGLGLGLAISRSLVERHGGEIRARSRGRGEGSVFELVLPAADARQRKRRARKAITAAESAPAPSKSGRARILLVEDHESTREALAALLKRREYDVATAGSMAEARLLAASRPFDLLVSDIGLPDGSGFALMAELRERHGLAGIALTGYGMEDDVARGREAGFSAHLTKPIRVQQLDEALAAVLDPPAASGV